ncbi:MAG: MBL fold metallo-hydrolase, partial [Bacteroidota bacterium]
MNKLLKVILISGSIPVVLILLLLVRYYIGNGKAAEANINLSQETLQLPQVENLTIIPLIDSKTVSNAYKTEDGVSYLIKTSRDTILFDVGYNKKDEKISPLLYNLSKMNLTLDEIEAIAISHAHVDHCGGIAVMKEKKV